MSRRPIVTITRPSSAHKNLSEAPIVELSLGCEATPPRKRRRRLKKSVKRVLFLISVTVAMLILRPWSWGVSMVSAEAVNDTIAAPVSLNNVLSNADSQFPEAARFDRVIEQFMRKWDIVGASLAIMKDGSLIYAKGYGWADREDSVRMEVRHVMRVASVSKLITATAAMKLYEQGKLRLDQKVFGLDGILNEPQFRDYTDKRVESITVDQLLRHRAGFSMRAGDPMFDPRMVRDFLRLPSRALTQDDYVLYSVKRGLGYRPGARTMYSNLGYVVLSKVIEQVAGVPYESYVRDSILAPIGCFDMHIGHSRHELKKENEVRYYETAQAEPVPMFDGSPGPYVSKSEGGNDIYGLSGAGGWIASPTEMLRLVSAIGGSNNSTNILKAETIRLMTETVKGELPIGWMRTDARGEWLRTGSMAGTSALCRKQSNGYVWFFVTNTSSWKGSRFPGYINSTVKAAFSKVTEWPERDMFDADSLEIEPIN